MLAHQLPREIQFAVPSNSSSHSWNSCKSTSSCTRYPWHSREFQFEFFIMLAHRLPREIQFAVPSNSSSHSSNSCWRTNSPVRYNSRFPPIRVLVHDAGALVPARDTMGTVQTNSPILSPVAHSAPRTLRNEESDFVPFLASLNHRIGSLGARIVNNSPLSNDLASLGSSGRSHVDKHDNPSVMF